MKDKTPKNARLKWEIEKNRAKLRVYQLLVFLLVIFLFILIVMEFRSVDSPQEPNSVQETVTIEETNSEEN